MIDELARQYLRFSEQVSEGRTMEGVETLRAVEASARAVNLESSPK